MKSTKPLQRLLVTLSDMVSASGLSFREIAGRSRKIYHTDITAYQVGLVSNKKFESSRAVSRLDTYVDAVLEVLGVDGDSLIERCANEISDGKFEKIKEARKEDIYSEEVRSFIENPKNKAYIEYAFNMKMEQEAKKKIKELSGRIANA